MLLIEKGDEIKLQQYQEWLNVHDLSMRLCHQPSDKVTEDSIEYEEDFFSTSEARISGVQAVTLLHHYLQKITVDRFTRLTPAWSQIHDNSNQAALWRGLGLGQENKFRFSLQLPHKTPLHFPVVGDSKPRADLAKERI